MAQPESTAQTAQVREPALVARTEYRDEVTWLGLVASLGLGVGALPLMWILLAADVSATVAAAIAALAVTAGLALYVGVVARRPTPAVTLGSVDGSVVIGTAEAERRWPLDDLVAVRVPAEDALTTEVDPDRRLFHVAGRRFVELTFTGGARYSVAYSATDPVAAEIVRRLQLSAPRKGAEPDEPDLVATSASAPADVRLWDAARDVHRNVLSEYGAYELDPALYLRYPGVTDIARDAVMDFHSALAEAQALVTDGYPGDAEYAGRYRGAVDALRRAWVRCERDGKAAGTAYLDSKDSADLDTAAKLFDHAEASDVAAERVTYLRKVNGIIVDLERRGRVHLPRPVVAAIEVQVRRALESGRE